VNVSGESVPVQPGGAEVCVTVTVMLVGTPSESS
jgi:hypothetical protein